MIGLLPTKVMRPMESSGMDLMHKKKRRSKEHWVRNGYRCQECVDERKEVRGFRSVLMRHELAHDGARGFGIGKGGLGMVLMAQKQIGVGTITVMTATFSAL